MAMTGDQNGPGTGSRVPLEEKALLTTGADYWSTHEIPELGLPRIRVADGPQLISVIQFPGFPVSDEDAEELLARL